MNALSFGEASTFQRLLSCALRHWVPIAVLSWLVSGALYLTLPPGLDQFQHAYLGWRLLEGDVPYRDVVDPNWPGVMALHAFAIWLFGINLWSWRAFDLALFVTSAAVLADLMKLAAGREAARVCVILSPLVYVGVPYSVVGQHDMSAAQFLVAALWFHVRAYERNIWWYQIGTGLCIGAAMLNKPTSGVIGLLLPIQAFGLHIPIRRVLVHTAAAGSIALTALLAALIIVLASGTSLREVLEATWIYNFGTQYTGAQTLGEMLFWLLRFHYQWIPAAALGSLPAVFWIFVRANRSMAATSLWVLWTAGMLSYFVQWRGLSYHLAPCLLALTGAFAISVAIVATNRIGTFETGGIRTAVSTILFIAFLGTGIKLAGAYHSLIPSLLARDYGLHLSRFNAGDEVTVADTVAFARRLEALPAKECVLVVGDATSISYLSRRHMPTRFYMYQFLENLHVALPMTEHWIDLWRADLGAARCQYVLVSRHVGERWLIDPGPASAALRKLLEQYRAAESLGFVGGIVVYERR